MTTLTEGDHPCTDRGYLSSLSLSSSPTSSSSQPTFHFSSPGTIQKEQQCCRTSFVPSQIGLRKCNIFSISPFESSPSYLPLQSYSFARSLTTYLSTSMIPFTSSSPPGPRRVLQRTRRGIDPRQFRHHL